jgi:hypothetical protein
MCATSVGLIGLYSHLLTPAAHKLHNKHRAPATAMRNDVYVLCAVCPSPPQVRQVDCVTVKGSNQPLGLFAYDLDLTAAQAAVAAMAAAAGGGSSSQERRLTRNSSGASAGSAGAAATGVSGLLPAVRHSLAVLPGAAGAARSSVVVSSASQGWGGGDDEGAGVDEAEVRSKPFISSAWRLAGIKCQLYSKSKTSRRIATLLHAVAHLKQCIQRRCETAT